MTFPNNDQLKKHLSRKHGKRIACAECDLEFIKKSSLRKHMCEVHGDGYECEHCGKKFSKRKNLNAHLARVRATLKRKAAQIVDDKEDEHEVEERVTKR